MADRITGPEITEFFRDGFEHTAWRLETRRSYGVAAEDDDFQAWLRGAPHRPDPDRPWLRVMRGLESAGKRVERVRILDDPPTDYQRWVLEDIGDSIAAGEDIRYLPRDHPQARALPERDFWLFDSHTIGVFHFDGDRSLGMELTDDRDQVLSACQIRDAAWHYALPIEALKLGV